MPRVIACAGCGTKVYAGPGSLGDGKTICRVCRRKRRPARPEPLPIVDTVCPTCGTTFTPARGTQVYCQPTCRPSYSRTKDSTTSRGYGAAHQALRAKWRTKVEAGLVDCARCGVRIEPGQPWDLGHTDDRSGYNGPECRTCNRSHGGRRRHELGAPVATDHLKFEWRDCIDCGARCYGRRCIDCHRARS